MSAHSIQCQSTGKKLVLLLEAKERVDLKGQMRGRSQDEDIPMWPHEVQALPSQQVLFTYLTSPAGR